MGFIAAGYQGPASILTISMTEFCDALRAEGGIWTDLQFNANVTASGEKAAALFDSVEMGRRHFCYAASGYLSLKVPELNILDLPFAHAHRDAFFRLLDGEAGAALKRTIAQKTGFHVLAFWDNGQRHISNALRPIHAPEDIAGMRIRTLDSDLYRACLNAMGFHAMTCDVKDLVSWVSRNVVDAQENPLTNYLGFDLHKHHPHVSLTGHFWGVLLLLCPVHWYLGLDLKTQAQIQDAASLATFTQRKLASQEDQKSLLRMRELGVACLSNADLDMDAFKRSVQPIRNRVQTAISSELSGLFGLSMKN